MFFRIMQTTNETTLAVLRIVLGAVMFAHAGQKVFGWFGGRGLSGTLSIFTEVYRIPVSLAVIAIVVEFLSSLGLIAGLMSRLSALGIIVIMLGAIATVTGTNGFYMNWFGKLPPGAEGYEYHLLAIAMGIAVMAKGGGAFSLDAMLSRNESSRLDRDNLRRSMVSN